MCMSFSQCARATAHVTTDAAGKFLFVVNGDGVNSLNQISVYGIDAATGDLTPLNVYPTATSPWATTVSPDGKFVYVRCDGHISVFALDSATGILTPKPLLEANTDSGTGGILVHPSGTLLVTVSRGKDLVPANTPLDLPEIPAVPATIEVFNIDATTGALTKSGTSYASSILNRPLELAFSHSGEFLFTKSKVVTAGGAPSFSLIDTYVINLQTSALSLASSTDTGIVQELDSFHGSSANPVLPVVYMTMVAAPSMIDSASYLLDMDHASPTFGQLTLVTPDENSIFGGLGSDNLVVSRNGKWAILTSYGTNQIAVCAVDPVTGALSAPVLIDITVPALQPVCSTFVGTIQ